MNKGDMGPPSRASSMHPLPRFPLMTPSASPPVQRPFGRQSSTPSPAKKRRVSRAPSVSTPTLRGFSATPSSSSSISPAFNFDASVDPGEELHAARRASSFRVLDVWSQLAEKYARPLDKDDIVDLRKEAIVKDCGVLRSSGDMFQIGYFAEEREKAERLDNGLPLVPVDDEPDELDAFADIPDNTSRSETDVDDEDGLELAQRTKRLPPVREIDPADAADLAEFLRAEQLRKETFGDPDEGDEDDGEEEEVEEESVTEGDAQGSEALEEQSNRDEDFNGETVVSGSDADEEAEYEGRDSENEDESVNDPDDDGHDQRDYLRLSTPSGSPEFDILDISNNEKESDVEELAEFRPEEPPPVAPDASSEDELGGWDRDEGSTLYSIGDFEGLSDQEKVEIADKPPQTTSPSKPRKNRVRGKAQETKKRSPSKKKVSVPRSPSPTVTQLQTPPRSTSFGHEPSNNKITTTYSRKRRGLSSSPKKTPLRIQSTESASSESEMDDPISLKTRRQISVSPSQTSPTKKIKLVPEVFIDDPRPSPTKKTQKEATSAENNHLDSPPKRTESTRRATNAKLKGKARELDLDVDSSVLETEPQANTSSSSRVHNNSESSRLHSTKNTVHESSPERSSNNSKKREYSPFRDELDEMPSTVDVAMASPTRSSFRSGSRRASSSRRSIVHSTDSHDERDPGPSSRPSRSHPSRRRSGEQLPENTPRSHPPPELDSFSFIPPHPPSVGYQSYPAPHYMPPFAHQQNASTLPNLQDPNAQYHLAQALQSLSILMGGALPFPPSPVNPSHIPHPSPAMVHNGHQPWSPYTPRHHDRSMTFDTPQSVATAPPTSPLGSDYSDSIPSSPTKHSAWERGRQRTKLHSSKPARPKSAIRESRSRSHSVRRVSFSSPEATQIEDYAYEYVSDNAIVLDGSDGEDSDLERRRQRREDQPNRSLRLQSPHRHVRAQTPGPPEHPSGATPGREDSRQFASTGREPGRRISKTGRHAEAQDRTRGRGHR